MSLLFQNAHVVVTVDPEHGLVRRVRNEVPYETPAEVELTNQALIELYDTMGREQRVLLVDSRLAPGRNDPDFEKVILRYAPRLYSGFRKVAMLNKTEVGRLQSIRLLSNPAPNVRVFTDEAAALAYLMAP